MKKSKKEPTRQLNIRHVVIDKGSRLLLKKVKEPIWGNVLYAIEGGNWWIPFDSYEYRDIKEHLETEVFHDFFKLPKDLTIKVKDFQTDILSFDKGH